MAGLPSQLKRLSHLAMSSFLFLEYLTFWSPWGWFILQEWLTVCCWFWLGTSSTWSNSLWDILFKARGENKKIKLWMWSVSVPATQQILNIWISEYYFLMLLNPLLSLPGWQRNGRVISSPVRDFCIDWTDSNWLFMLSERKLSQSWIFGSGIQFVYSVSDLLEIYWWQNNNWYCCEFLFILFSGQLSVSANILV